MQYIVQLRYKLLVFKTHSTCNCCVTA